MRTPFLIAIALLVPAISIVSACGGGPVPGIDDGGPETTGRDGGGGRSDGGGRDGGKSADGGRDASDKNDASDKSDASTGCPPPNATVCGQPCATPGLHCPGSEGNVQCVTEPDGDTIWLCVTGTESAPTQ